MNFKNSHIAMYCLADPSNSLCSSRSVTSLQFTVFLNVGGFLRSLILLFLSSFNSVFDQSVCLYISRCQDALIEKGHLFQSWVKQILFSFLLLSWLVLPKLLSSSSHFDCWPISILRSEKFFIWSLTDSCDDCVNGRLIVFSGLEMISVMVLS